MTEKPLSKPYYNFEFSAGNRNLIEPSIDVSGPLTEDGQLLYRLNALYRREDYYRDFDVAVERFFIAPVLQWKISERTDLFLNFEYLDDQRPADFGLVAIGDRVADIPFERNLGELDDELTAESIRASYRLKHRFNENWTFKNAFNFLTYDTVYQSVTALELDETTSSALSQQSFNISDRCIPTSCFKYKYMESNRNRTIEDGLFIDSAAFKLVREQSLSASKRLLYPSTQSQQ